MATQIQFRRGNTSQHSTFTGAVGEVTVDTEKNVVVVHDGSTAGGFPVANSSVAATAYSNAVSYTDTAIGTANTAMAANAATAYSNATSYADTIAGTAYSNAVAYAASNTYVNNTFAPLSGATFTGALSGTDLTLSGNLTVSGTRTYVNSTTLDVGDNIITLNADLGASAPSENAGIEVMRGTSANVQLIWNETSDAWTFTNDGSTYYELASNTDVDTAYSNAVSYAASNTYVNSTFAPTADPTFTGNATFDTSTLFVDGTNDRVGIGTSSPSTKLDVSGSITVNTNVVQDSNSATLTLNPVVATEISSFAAATYRTAKFIVSVTSGTDYHATEIMVLHDGTSTYITEYSTIYDNISLATFTADISGGNVRLLATPSSISTHTFKLSRTLIKV